jgi:hypothetical protein
MSEKHKYLAIKNWHRYQPDNRLRSKDAVLPWIRDYCDREDDAEFRSLTMYQREVLQGLCRLVGRTRARLIQNDITYIAGALHILPRERAHLPLAVSTLTSLGFLIPCNEQLKNEIGEKTGGEGEGEPLPLENENERDLSVSGLVSQSTETPAVAGGACGGRTEILWEDAEVPAFDLPCWTPLHEEFGAGTQLPEEVVRDIHTVLKQRGLDVAWMRGCVQFALTNGFWKNRTPGSRAFAKHLVHGFEGEDADNKLPAQYNRYVLAKCKSAVSGGKR